MNEREWWDIQPWIDAGIGVPVAGDPEPLLLRKGVLEEVEGGYALTEKGYRMARHRIERPPPEDISPSG